MKYDDGIPERSADDLARQERERLARISAQCAASGLDQHAKPGRPKIPKPRRIEPPAPRVLVVRTLPIAERVIAVVAEAFGVTPKLIRSDDRCRRVAWPRQIAAYLLKLEGLTLGEAANQLSRSDHTTAHYAVHRVRKAMEADPLFAKQIEGLRKRVQDEGTEPYAVAEPAA